MIDRFIHVAHNLYLLRVPLASILTFPLFSLLALGQLESLLGNLIKGLDPIDCVTLSYTAYLAAIAAGFAGWVIEMRAPDRLGVASIPLLPEVGQVFRILVPLAPLLLLVPAILYSSAHWFWALTAAIGGALLAFLQALLALALYFLLPRNLSGQEDSPEQSKKGLWKVPGVSATTAMLQRTAPAPTLSGRIFPDPPAEIREWFARGRALLESQLRNPDSPFYTIPPLLFVSLALLLLSLMRWLILGVTGWLGPGYFADAEARRRREPYPEHVLSLSFFLLVFLGYLVTGYLKIVYLAEPTEFSTAGYLCIILTLLTTTLAGITFALDRWPGVATTLTVALALAIGVVPSAGLTDHYFAVESLAPGAAPPAPSLLSDNPSRVIVVTAAGGGIQAAAWTAAVLTGLDEEIPDFRGSLRATSGVSGGSVGLMYYLTSFPGPQITPDARREILDRAMASSLDELAAGFTYLDVLRIPLAPWRRARLLDRGRALELTFARRAELEGVRLQDWARATAEGNLPAVIFNAVEVETGRPVLFSTTAIDPPLEETQLRRDGSGPPFRLGEAGVEIATAVRLSASFPFATPVARPLYPADSVLSERALAQSRIHLADGGYYDNYGVTAMAHWLNAALSPNDSAPTEILFLQIRSFPPLRRQIPLRSFLFQYTAPLTTLLSVREEAQRLRNQEYLRVLEGYWQRNNPAMKIQQMTADYLPAPASSCYGSEPPLSWRLRPDQQQCILQVWEENRAEILERVATFLSDPPGQ